jgi:hypothetical protein
MAHSFDTTLLARLGFADPDRKKPEHDLACQYLRDTGLPDGAGETDESFQERERHVLAVARQRGG